MKTHTMGTWENTTGTERIDAQCSCGAIWAWIPSKGLQQVTDLECPEPKVPSKMSYKECTILAASGGFGEYEVGEYNGEAFEDQDALIDAMREGAGFELFELGKDELPEGLEDIRGRIRNEPARVLGGLDDHDVPHYFGVSEI